jgi:CubicO group peptidase (beta-lactamase class C family)
MTNFRLVFVCVLIALAVSPRWTPVIGQAAPTSLDGLWEAKMRFGPDIAGTLILKQVGKSWIAEISGHTAIANVSGGDVSFELAAGQGKFVGGFDARRNRITGHWRQADSPDGGSYLSPVTLDKNADGQFRGTLMPLPTAMTFFLIVKKRDDGTTGAFIRNPERNLGWTQFRVNYLERDGDAVKLFAANTATAKGRLLANGRYDAETDTLHIYFPSRGGTYDFRRIGPDEATDFFPRGRPGVQYSYSVPPAFGDGWPVASVDEVGLSRAAVEKFIQEFIDVPQESIDSPQIHGILIARHGKLVVEEYFHGENRERAHETRSASKSIASDTAGAVIQSGVPLSASSPVYKVMNGGEFPADLEPRKRAMTLENLMSMSSGLDCDEGNDKSRGYEDNFWDNQDQEPDFYKKTLALPMVRDPGAERVYCSASANLTAGVVSKAAKKPFRDLFRELIADPLGISRYYFISMPNADAYMGGGARLLPRDFMKLAQVHVNGGTWQGRRIYSQKWSRVATSALNKVPFSKQDYGYLWWSQTYDLHGKPLRVYYASGNGGNLIFGIPDLDMVVAIYAANQNHRVGVDIQNNYIPRYILPLVSKP